MTIGDERDLRVLGPERRRERILASVVETTEESSWVISRNMQKGNLTALKLEVLFLACTGRVTLSGREASEPRKPC